MWKNQFCNLVEKQISYEEANKKDPNCTLKEGVLEDEAKFLNRVFIKNMTKKLPYVVLKTATTMDGKIASKTGDSKWITSEKARIV